MQNWQCDCVVNLPHCDRQCHILRHLRSEQVPPFYFLDVFSLSRFCILNYLVHHACQPLFVMMLGIVIVLWCCGSIFSTTVVYKPTHKTTIINNLQDNICPTWHDLVVAVIAIANILAYIFRCLYHAKYDEKILKRVRAHTWKPKTSSWINVIKGTGKHLQGGMPSLSLRPWIRIPPSWCTDYIWYILPSNSVLDAQP